MRILLVGGGSGGPVSPLLSIAEELKKKSSGNKPVFLLVGTNRGPERIMAEKDKIKFVSIPAGKFRRYFSLKNFISPVLILWGFIKSFKILRQFKPDCIFGTGSYVQVPMIWAAWFFKIPIVIHQQDYVPSLANKLCQIPANKITVSFEDSLKDFASNFGLFFKKKKDKVVFTGNPFRKNLKNSSKEKALKFFKLKKDLPTLLVLGGGTGASYLNFIVRKSLPELTKVVQIIHSTGKRKYSGIKHHNYHAFEFIPEMEHAYAAADAVLCRAGLSTITELANLNKVSIVVPMPKSHQEVNAFYLFKKKASIVIPQKNFNTQGFIQLMRRLFFEQELLVSIKKNIATVMPKDSTEKITKIILETAK